MKRVTYNDGRIRRTIARDAHESQTIHVVTETNETPCIEANKRIRANRLLERDAKNPLVDGDVIAFSFSFPTPRDFQAAQARDPEIFEDLMGDRDFERFRAAERLELLYPQYVTTVRRGDRTTS